MGCGRWIFGAGEEVGDESSTKFGSFFVTVVWIGFRCGDDLLGSV
jgi:hypothetical protein